MKRDFIPGVEVLCDFEGEQVAAWHPDEDGALRYEQRAAEWFATEPGAGLVPVAITAEELASMEWQIEIERRIHAHLVDEGLREAVEWGDVQSAAVALGASEEAAAASAALGLVSVLSSQKRHPTPRRKAAPRTPFAVQASRAEVIHEAGAFVAGGDDARMAKLRRSVGFTARAHGALRAGHRPDEVRMLTLTYADKDAWRPDHVSALMDNVRKWHGRHGVKCRYVWIAEIQDGKRRGDGYARGAVHYHVALWVPVGTPHMPKADKQGWWPHGSTRTELAKGAVQYLMHYLKKGNSKNFAQFPDGCRIYSVGGLDHSLRRARRWLGLPGFVRGNSSYFDDWRRAPIGTGGGWIAPSGEHFPSEFRRISCGGVHCLQRVLTHARVIDADGPFAWLTDRQAANAAHQTSTDHSRGLPC